MTVRECFYCRWWNAEDKTCRVEYPYTARAFDYYCDSFDADGDATP